MEIEGCAWFSVTRNMQSACRRRVGEYLAGAAGADSGDRHIWAMERWTQRFCVGYCLALRLRRRFGRLARRRFSARSTWAGSSGSMSGLGAATADAIHGALAAFGLSLITAFLVEQQLWLGLAGGLFLCYLGVRTVTAPRRNRRRREG